jgi:ferredoxin--NADP+ reductase
MSRSVAIVGSGPAGFYCAEAICKGAPEVRVDILDRLPTPYGLVRSGVAPDHQGTKNVWRVFQRTAQRPQVRFLGNVEVGRDLSIDELLGAYDAVVLALGVGVDRKLGIEGEELPGVYGSGELSAWYNGHPDFAGLEPELRGPGIAVIGNGNVAVDVVRVLGRTRPEMRTTDIPDYAMTRIERASYTELYMLGRRGPMEASFTTAELRELGEMDQTVAVVDAAQLPEAAHADDPKQQKLKEKILDTLRGYSQNDPASKPKRLHMRFCAAPTRIIGVERVEGLEVAVTRVEGGRATLTGETYVLPVGTIISAIGFTAKPLEGVPLAPGGSCYANVDGKIRDRLWAVGWAKRGPSGVVATNRQDSIDVASLVMRELAEGPARPGPEAIDALLRERRVGVVTFADWERIEEVERSTASEGAPRRKITDKSELLATAAGGGAERAGTE